jgi:hypothetical protein
MTQPLTCPFCNAARIGIQESMHLYKCGTKLFIRPERKPRAERSQECVEAAK